MYGYNSVMHRGRVVSRAFADWEKEQEATVKSESTGKFAKCSDPYLEPCASYPEGPMQRKIRKRV